MSKPSLTVRAEEVALKPPIRLEASSESDAEEIQSRMAAGLFTAKQIRPQAKELTVSWAVLDYKAPWVFARDIRTAKRIYDSIP